MNRLKCAQSAALFLNLGGTILLGLSFQATASDFRLITAHGYDVRSHQPSADKTAYAICVNNYALAVTDATSGLIIGTKNCPQWESAKPAAVVTSEYPWLGYTGLLSTGLGFLLQLLIVSEFPPLMKLLGPQKPARKRR